MPWFVDSPKFLEEELSALKEHGFSFRVHEKDKHSGKLRIDVAYEIEGNVFNLVCIYPSSFPYFSVAVYSPDFPEGRHKNPTDNRLCLFADDQSSWSPKDNLAGVIANQIPLIYRAHLNPESPDENEANEGYQISGQIFYQPFSVIFVPKISQEADENFGRMKINFWSDDLFRLPIQGMVWEIDDSRIEFDSDYYGTACNLVNARWVKLPNTPREIEPEDFLEEACRINANLRTPDYGKKNIDIIAIGFPEETTYRQKDTNWVFLVRRRQRKGKRSIKYRDVLIPSDSYTENNLYARTPRVRDLKSKKIIVIGAGALGSQIIWQLARAGVEAITIVDHDVIQAGNIPRWIVGFPYIGTPKVLALKDFLSKNYPGIKINPIQMRIGVDVFIPLGGGKEKDAHDFLKSLIERTDIVIDAAAEQNVSHYLSDTSQACQTPYVWATATDGAWGGIVGRVVPEKTKGTWLDFIKQYGEGSVASPPAEERKNIQPTGCFSPTFSGTGFDLDHVSLMATRLSISTLLSGHSNSYPDFPWDLGILHLWNEQNSLPIAPHWDTYQLDRHEA